MCEELRDLHDRIGATTIYVTHDQFEAMAMADQIAVMNGGKVDQIGTPQEIYDQPASMFVADFIGWPPMNFVRFEGTVARGSRSIHIRETSVAVPEVQEEGIGGPLALGMRPEHVLLADTAPIRGSVFGTEYLGTTQIVTVDTDHGQIKARIPSSVQVGLSETVGLAFRAEGLVIFDTTTGRALKSALNGRNGHG